MAEKFEPKTLDGDDKPIKDDLDLNQATLLKLAKDSPLGIPGNVLISDEKWAEIRQDIKDIIDQVKSDKEEMIGKIEEWELAVQGEPLPEDMSGDNEPFKDSCKLRSSLTGTTCRIVERKIIRTVLVEPYYIAEVKGDKEAEVRLRDYANHKCKHDFDFRETVRNVAVVACETPAAILLPERIRTIRTDIDYEIIEDAIDPETELPIPGTGLAAFKAKYPTAESADLSKTGYKQKLEEVKMDLETVKFHDNYIQVDVVVNKSMISVIHPTNFFKFPWTADFENSKLFGHYIEKTYDQLEMLEKDGQLKNVIQLRKRLSNSNVTNDNDTTKEIQNEKSGVQETHEIIEDDVTTKIFRLIKGLVKLNLTKDGRSYFYEYWYAPSEDVLLRLAPYVSNYKKPNYIPATIWKKSNTWIGECLPEQTENPQEVCDVITRQYIDGNSIAGVPQMVMSMREKSRMDHTHETFQHKVGKIWYLTNINGFQQLKMQRPDGASFLQLIQHIYQDTDSRSGASRSAAGQTLSGDPDAPGNKTMALLQQSQEMIAIYIDQLRPAFDEAMKHLIKQDYQELRNQKVNFITKNAETGKVEAQDFGREQLKFVDPDTTFTLRNQTLDDNIAQRTSEARQDIELTLADPMIANRPKSKRILWKNYFMQRKSWTMEEIEELIPSEEQLKKDEVEVQKELQLQQELKQQDEALQGELQEQGELNEQAIDEIGAEGL